MSNKYPCIYYDNGKCQKFSDEKYNSWCDFDQCEHQTPSIGDRIRSMSDEELAEWIITTQQSAMAFVCESVGFSAPSPEEIDEKDFKTTFEWLQKPYKEDT